MIVLPTNKNRGIIQGGPEVFLASLEARMSYYVGYPVYVKSFMYKGFIYARRLYNEYSNISLSSAYFHDPWRSCDGFTMKSSHSYGLPSADSVLIYNGSAISGGASNWGYNLKDNYNPEQWLIFKPGYILLGNEDSGGGPDQTHYDYASPPGTGNHYDLICWAGQTKSDTSAPYTYEGDILTTRTGNNEGDGISFARAVSDYNATARLDELNLFSDADYDTGGCFTLAVSFGLLVDYYYFTDPYEKEGIYRNLLLNAGNLTAPVNNFFHLFARAKYVQSVNHAAVPFNFANSITGKLSQSISLAATPLEAVSTHLGGAFIQPGPVSGVLSGTLDIVGSVYIGEGYIHSATALDTTCAMSSDGLIWSFVWDAEDALSADVELLGNSLQGVIIEAAPLGASFDLESVSGISFVLSSVVEELNLTLTGDQAAYVEKEEVLESTTSLEGQAVISHNLAVLPLEFESTIQGDMIPVGSVNWSSSTLEESGTISADLVQSVGRDAEGQLALAEDILGSPTTQYSVIFDASTLTGYLTLTWNFERFQFVLKGNYRKTDLVSKLETDIVLKGGQNAA